MQVDDTNRQGQLPSAGLRSCGFCCPLSQEAAVGPVAGAPRSPPQPCSLVAGRPPYQIC